ncbi:MAG TPA: hypothetical protein VN706_17320 [Gemmatimonadaceae bacterium]|nr:hypothetical protein [Gemmatimonadaceae bacterium]
MMRFHVAIAAMAAAAALLPAVVFSQASPVRPRTLPGFTYTVHISSTPTTHGSATMPSSVAAVDFTGSAVVAGGRGRLDIVAGGAEGMFEKGDYLLFDSLDVVIVHPATREFVPVPRNFSSGSMDQMQAMGVKATVSDEKVVLDSLGAADTIAGVPTRRYRMTVAFNMAMDGGLVQQRIGTESVTDYWVAVIPGMPSNPLLRVNGLAGGGVAGMFRVLTARVDSAAARMGQAIALKTRATTHMLLGPGATMETQQASDVSALKRGPVDESLLMLPAGYKISAASEMTSDAAEKWRRPPTD